MSRQKIHQYWWYLNGLVAEPFSFPNFMDCSDVEWDLILNGLGIRSFNGNITERKAAKLQSLWIRSGKTVLNSPLLILKGK
jgi:hypothetical protein